MRGGCSPLPFGLGDWLSGNIRMRIFQVKERPCDGELFIAAQGHAQALARLFATSLSCAYIAAYAQSHVLRRPITMFQVFAITRLETEAAIRYLLHVLHLDAAAAEVK